MSESEDNIEATPPSAQRVARRALVLSAVVCRGNIDRGAGDAEAESVRNRILDWIASLDVQGETEPHEAALLKVPLGALTGQQVIDATWQAEGLAVLAWALKRLNLPKHDEKVDPYAVTDALEFLSEDAAELIRSAQLRGDAEIRALRELYYDIHVALRDFERHRRLTNFTRWVNPAHLAVLDLKLTALVAGGDLQLGGQPLGVASEDQRRLGEWIMRQRHRASIWLVGEESVYSEVSADT